MSSAPLQVEGLRVARRTMDTITLAWTASAGARSYKVQYGSSGWVGVAWGDPVDAKKATAYTVKGLTGSTTYYFRVIPCGDSIDGPATDGLLHASTLSQEEDYNRLKTENKELAARADGHTEHRTMATKIDEMMARVAAAEAEVQTKNVEMKAMSGQLQACKHELRACKERCEAIDESSVQDLQDQLATATAARDAALEQLEQLGQDAAEARKELERAQEAAVRAAVERCEEEAKSTLAKALAELRESLEPREGAVAEVSSELREAQAAAEEHKQSAAAATEAANAQVARYKDMVTASSRKVASLFEQVESLELQNTTLSGEVMRLTLERDSCVKDMETAKRELEAITNKCKVLSAKVETAEARAAELERLCAERAGHLAEASDSDEEVQLGTAMGSATQPAASDAGNEYVGWADPIMSPYGFLGKRVAVMWTKPTGPVWYTGVIESFEPSNHQHNVRFDDGELKQYDLKTRVMRWLD